ncbi:helicase HerA domain-containing protein [Thermovibrio sp.]
MEVLTSDQIYGKIEELVKRAEVSIWLSSAWLKSSVLERLFAQVPENTKDLKVVLRASELQDLLITDEKVFEILRKWEIYLHPRLHAKFILVDGRYAVVGSANFTYSGLSEFSKGNVEAAVYYDETDDPEEVEKLKNYFIDIVESKETFRVDGSLVGFAMNPVKSRSFEFVALEEVKEQDYVEIRDGDRKLIGRVLELYSYDMDFFANPFTAGESPVFGSLDTFKLLFAKGENSDWKKAAVWAYLNDNGAKLKLAVASVVGELKNRKLETSLSPVSVGSPVFKLSEDDISSLLRKNFSGADMVRPVKVGKLVGSSAEAFIDASEVLSKHLLVLGTTGSGKSYFTKLFLKRLLEADPEVKVFILDPHGEYREGLGSSAIEELTVEDLLLPVFPEEVEELIKQEGGSSLISGNSKEASKNRSLISKAVRPSLGLTAFREKSLRELIREFSDRNNEKEALLSSLSDVYDGQPNLVRALERALNSASRVVIFNFKRVSEPSTRVNVAGLVMRELFERAKRGDIGKTFLVLEEAHSFAPERGFGDTSAGRDNLALTMARKIASEGRKFNLGLGVITQRPAQVSKYVLSQTNTQVMFRTINSSDLDVISSFVEYAGEDVVSLLPSLQTGMGVVCGIGTPFPLLINVE